ncbi:WxL domain-containing protein [Levilactobacillus yiduensis]|uniref:WxL domain-containing protein n=1 Tax=Levilactobacillus yiduensis TaxID=2953880 RepID=UPI001FD66FE9|nr:WxL domain-containing protein [Levilactobacillus yiduensis]
MKMKTGLLASAVVLGMALALPMGASAADTDSGDSATKSASVDVTAGSLLFTKDGGMQMAPSFQFKANVGDTNGTKNGNQTVDTSNKATSDTYTGTDLGVDDETGSGDGWQVTAELGEFKSTDGSDKTLGATLTMPATTVGSTTSTPKELTAGGAGQVVFQTDTDHTGMGESTADLSGTTLALPTNAYAGTYVATLKYTLTSGPDSTTA